MNRHDPQTPLRTNPSPFNDKPNHLNGQFIPPSCFSSTRWQGPGTSGFRIPSVLRPNKTSKAAK